MWSRIKGSGGSLAAGAAACLLAAALCSCTLSESASPLDFTLTNLTGRGVVGVYVSPHDSDRWGENLLGEERLPTHQSVEIRFRPEGEEVAVWDLRIESRAGYAAEWKGLNLREVFRITLRVETTGEPVVVAEVE